MHPFKNEKGKALQEETEKEENQICFIEPEQESLTWRLPLHRLPPAATVYGQKLNLKYQLNASVIWLHIFHSNSNVVNVFVC